MNGNGLGAERELALMGEVQRLRKELAAANDERARLRGPVVEYKRGFGPGDSDSAALTETGNAG